MQLSAISLALTRLGYVSGGGSPPAPSGDTLFMYNTLLLHGDGANGATNNSFLVTPPGGVGSYTGLFNSSNITAAYNTALDISSGDFTIEFWVNAPAQSGGANAVRAIAFFDGSPFNTAGIGWDIVFNTTGAITFEWCSGTSVATSAATGTSACNNTWNHVAVTRSGSTFTIYLNGVSQATGTSSASCNTNAAWKTYIGSISANNVSNIVSSYISNFRMVKGTAVYTGAFTPPTSPLTAISGTGLLTCQSATFIDNSTNALTITNNGTATIVNPNTFPTITRNGSATQGSFSPYGSLWGIHFPNPQMSGSNQTYPDFLTVNSANVNLSGSTYTLEAWVFPTVLSSGTPPQESLPIFDWWAAFNNRWGVRLYTSGSGVVAGVYSDGSIISFNGSTVYPINQWMHVAVTYDGTTTRIFINGTLHASSAASYARNLSLLYIGKDTYQSGSNTDLGGFQGYMSNVRILKGTALYTSAFTPPTANLTAITNTVLLLGQANRFVDSSSGALAITPNGSVSIQRFAPFEPTQAYSLAANGGSAYFSGTTGEYLTVGSALPNVPAGAFTFEAWVYPLTTNGVQFCLGSNANYRTVFYASSGGGLGMDIYFQVVWNNFTNTETWKPRQWNHVAWVRDAGGVIYTYINGIKSSSSVTNNVAIGSGTYLDINASENHNTQYQVYVSDVRLSPGIARYTANFTPNTAPLAADTNTEVLLNMTNAGITDSAAGNDLTTVGNAQVSTTQSKFGGSSIYLDGAGDYLTVQAQPWTALAGSSYTLEAWVYITSTTEPYQHVFKNGTQNVMFIDYSGGSNGVLYSSDGTTAATKAGVTPNAWHHLAVVRNGTSLTCYVDGVAGTTVTANPGASSPAVSYVGWDAGSAPPRYLNGYIDDLRVTKGVARYTANFTPPAATLPDF